MGKFYSNKDMTMMSSKQIRSDFNYYCRLEHCFVVINTDILSHNIFGIPNVSVAFHHIGRGLTQHRTIYSEQEKIRERVARYGQLAYFMQQDHENIKKHLSITMNYQYLLAAFLHYSRFIAHIFYLLQHGVKALYFGKTDAPETQEHEEQTQIILNIIMGYYSDSAIGGTI